MAISKTTSSHAFRKGFLFCVFFCALLLLNACDGIRQSRMDIDLKDELPAPEYVTALKIVDDIATKYDMRCFSAGEASRDYGNTYGDGSPGIHLQSAVSEKGTFAIKLWEFGPSGATKEYEAVKQDLKEALNRQFPQAAITMNPTYCQSPHTREFTVKLHDRPQVFSFRDLGRRYEIEPEFSKASEAAYGIADRNGMTRKGCSAYRNDHCKRFAGGDFVGLAKAVNLEIHGYSDSALMRVKLVDLTCAESALAKQVYHEMLERMTSLFGAASVNISPGEVKN